MESEAPDGDLIPVFDHGLVGHAEIIRDAVVEAVS